MVDSLYEYNVRTCALSEVYLICTTSREVAVFQFLGDSLSLYRENCYCVYVSGENWEPFEFIDQYRQHG
jgi:hypothetical protein